MPVRTYAAGDEQSRLEAINSVEGAKFSYREDAVQKDEIETGIRIAAQSKAVTSVSAYAGSLKASDVVKAVGDFFDSVGGTVENPQLGDVTLGRRGIKSDLAHGVGRNKVAAFMAVPSILERGNVVDYQVNWKGRGYDTAVVAAPIQIEGVAYLAGVLLKRSNSVNRFYVHEVLTIEEGTALFNQAALQNEDVDSGSDVPSMNSILQRVLDVKNQISAAEHTAEAGDDEIAQRIALEQSGAEFSARVYEQTDDEILSALDTSSLHTQAEREAYFRWERRRAQYQNWQNTVDELRRQYDAVEDKSSSEARTRNSGRRITGQSKRPARKHTPALKKAATIPFPLRTSVWLKVQSHTPTTAWISPVPLIPSQGTLLK